MYPASILIFAICNINKQQMETVVQWALGIQDSGTLIIIIDLKSPHFRDFSYSHRNI